MRSTRWRAGSLIVATVVSLTLAACGLSDDPNQRTADTEPAKAGSLASAADLEGSDYIVGSKEFTEQLILCHLTSRALTSVGAKVESKCGLTGDGARKALEAKKIDMYWEYTGTGWLSILQQTEPIADPEKLYQAVSSMDLEKNGIHWLEPAPANNTYAISVLPSTQKEKNVYTLSDFARLVRQDPQSATLCLGSEFATRDDGLPGLEKRYDFKLPEDSIVLIDGQASYEAVSSGKSCKFGQAFATDGRIEALGLGLLKDDKGFFPIYNPSLTMTGAAYERNPAIAEVFAPISAKLTTEELQKLNALVDIDGQDPAKVASEWLVAQGFVK